MSARILVLAFLVAAPSAFAMGHWQGEHAKPAEDLSTVRINAPIITRPGTGAAEAVRYLAGAPTPAPVLAAAPAAPAPIPVATAPIGPPPEDVSIRFRRDVTAVLTSGEPHVVLAGGRRIGRGEVYQDGWRVSDISSQRAVLAKGRETRSIDLFSAPPPSPVQLASAAPILTGPVAFSNGLLPDQRAGQAARIPVQTQQIELMQQMRERMQGRQRGGGNNNNNNNGGGRRNFQGGFQAGPNGGFGGGGFNGANVTVRRGQQGDVRTVVVAPPPPPPPPAGGNDAD